MVAANSFVRRLRARMKNRVVLLTTVLVGLLVLAGTVHGIRIAQHVAMVDAGMAAAESAIADVSILERSDLEMLRQRIYDGEQALRALRWEIAPALWIAPVLSVLPVYGGDIANGRDILDYALHLVSAADMTLRGLEPVADIVQDASSLTDLLPKVAAALEENADLYVAASEEIAQAKEARAKVDESRLSPANRARLAKGDALSLRLDTLTALGLRSPPAIAALLEIQQAASQIGQALQGLTGTISSDTLVEVQAAALRLEQAKDVFSDERLLDDIALVLAAMPTSDYAGLDPSALPRLLGLATEITTAALPLLSIGADVASLPDAATLDESVALVRTLLMGRDTELIAAVQAVQRAADHKAALAELSLPVEMRQLVDLADEYLPLLDSGINAALFAPPMLTSTLDAFAGLRQLNLALDTLLSGTGNGDGLDNRLLEDARQTAIHMRTARDFLEDETRLRDMRTVLAMLPPSLSADLEPETLRDALRIGDELLQAVIPLIELAVELGALPQDSDLQATMTLMAATFESRRRDLTDAQQAAQRARTHRAGVRVQLLPDNFQELFGSVDVYLPLVSDAVDAALVAPEALLAAQDALTSSLELSDSFAELMEGSGTVGSVLIDVRKATRDLDEVGRKLDEAAPVLDFAAASGSTRLDSFLTLLDLATNSARHLQLMLEGFDRVASASAAAPEGSDSPLQQLSWSLQGNRETFLEARATLDIAQELRVAIVDAGLDESLQSILVTMAEGFAVSELALGFALDGSDLADDVLFIQSEMETLALLLSRENLFRSEPEELPEIQRRLESLGQRIESLQVDWEAMRPLFPLLESQKLADGDAVTEALSAAGQVVEAAQSLLSGLQLLLSSATHGLLTDGFGETMGAVLIDWRDQSQLALDALAPLTGAERESDSQYALSLSRLLGPDLGELEEDLVQIHALSETAHTLFGFDGAQTFIVLGQSDRELRPTGGFIGTVAEVTFDNGAMTIDQLKDSYNIDPDVFSDWPIGPPAFWKYMAAQPAFLSFRDSNWWPDFPTSAREALFFYERTQPTRPAGVIALNSWVLARLIDSLGGVVVPGVEGPVDGAMARDLLALFLPYPCRLENIEAFWPSTRDSRCFSEDLMNALLVQLQQSGDSMKLGQLFLDLLEEKHLLLYSTDPQLRETLNILNWDGHLKGSEGDYLATFDWSAYTKAYDFIQTRFTYDVTIAADGAALGELKVEYVNTGEPGDRCVQFFDARTSPCYWNYSRVYVPYGIELFEEPFLLVPETSLYEVLSAQLGKDVHGENSFEISLTEDHTVMGAFFVVDGGETYEMEFRYRLPPGTVEVTEDGALRYHLTIQKQPGAVAQRADVTVHLPAGSTVLEVSTEAAVVGDDVLVFALDLTVDRQITIVFQPPVAV